MAKDIEGSPVWNQTASLFTAPIVGLRKEAVERLKEHALKGSVAFEQELERVVRDMAAQNGHKSHEGVTLSQMQKARVIGASSLYIYACAFRRLLRAGDQDAIRSATARSLSRSRVVPTVDAGKLVATLVDLHKQGLLKQEHYVEIGMLLEESPPVDVV